MKAFTTVLGILIACVAGSMLYPNNNYDLWLIAFPNRRGLGRMELRVTHDLPR